MATVIVKLGGAAITDKSIPDALSPNLDALVDKVAQVYQDAFRPLGSRLILIHGAGSFGHPPAKKYQVKAGWREAEDKSQATDEVAVDARQQRQRCDKIKFGMALTRQRVIQLHHHILQRLQERGNLPVLSVSTYDTVETDQGALTEASSSRLVARVQHLLTQGFIPLLFGDAVLDHAWGSTILSGDALMHRLATSLPTVQRCVFVTDVAGIYTQDPKRYADAMLIRQLHCSRSDDGAVCEDHTTTSVDDVTGAMRSKWQWAKRIMTEAHQVSRVIICQAAESGKAIAVVDTDVAAVENAWTTVLR
ncbi:hypothetical protein QQS21_003130 [Conoideocrella luteorostrata]|uniref:Isopentenyl phosphate kinase n=1 Tax=Conoideocrella luteorostrata TaxID=1105319 RepID=A0AAJ0FVU1_9HYPO|nr:hypothetical protein QQS21_003130 [Conoideocrella luteorostrata]